MLRKTDRQKYKILKEILYHREYRALAAEYREAVDALQAASQTFSADQWRVIRRYQEVFLQLHEEMLKIALRSHSPKGR